MYLYGFFGLNIIFEKRVNTRWVEIGNRWILILRLEKNVFLVFWWISILFLL